LTRVAGEGDLRLAGACGRKVRAGAIATNIEVATGSDAFIRNSGSDAGQRSRLLPLLVTRGDVAIHYTGQASAHVWHSYYAEIPQ
jgi:hypothetical protein